METKLICVADKDLVAGIDPNVLNMLMNNAGNMGGANPMGGGANNMAGAANNANPMNGATNPLNNMAGMANNMGGNQCKICYSKVF